MLNADLGDHPARSAARAELVEVHPRAYVAGTQPVDARVLLAAMAAADGHRDWAVMEAAAVWLHGYGAEPGQLVVGVASTRRLAVRPPAKTRRVAAWLLEGTRVLDGVRVVALETALVQVASTSSHEDLTTLVERAVRDRRTTLTRLRARRRRGFKGSAAVGRVCDELSGGSMDADVRRLKAALQARGIHGLEVEVRFRNAAGATAYADLLDRLTMTALEVDGYVTHTERSAFRSDRRRDRWMRTQHGVTTLRVDVAEIRQALDAVADELVAFLLQQPGRLSA